MIPSARPTPLCMSSTTERLILEPLSPSHADALFGVMDDDQIYAYVPTPRLASRELLSTYFARLAAGPGEDRDEAWLNWALRVVADGRYIGTLQATVFGNRIAWIGYLLHPGWWHQGYAREACRWLIDELSMRYGVREIRASVDDRNLASIGLLNKLGFAFRGSEQTTLHDLPSVDHLYGLDCGARAV